MGGVAAVFVVVLWLAMSLFGAVLGYAQAEGRYVTSFLSAGGHLRSYAQTGDHTSYEAFEDALVVARAYRETRYLLEAGGAEREARARDLLVRTGTAPADADDMVGLFPYFSAAPSLRPAMTAWAKADEQTCT